LPAAGITDEGLLVERGLEAIRQVMVGDRMSGDDLI
jgi:hypothetical protein